jgi:hypothetical protein
VSGELGAILRNDLTVDSRTVTMERVLVIRDWSLPADRPDAYLRLVSDLSQNAAKLYARTFFGWLGAVIIWWLAVVVLPSMCSGPARQ